LQRQEYLAERAAMDEDEVKEEREKKTAGNRPVRTHFDPTQFRVIILVLLVVLVVVVYVIILDHVSCLCLATRGR
jgi:hypothetical protein